MILLPILYSPALLVEMHCTVRGGTTVQHAQTWSACIIAVNVICTCVYIPEIRNMSFI